MYFLNVIYLIIFSAQPYMLSSMKLRLWDGDERSYRYFNLFIYLFIYLMDLINTLFFINQRFLRI
jgi:hypothetical protein